MTTAGEGDVSGWLRYELFFFISQKSCYQTSPCKCALMFKKYDHPVHNCHSSSYLHILSLIHPTIIISLKRATHGAICCTIGWTIYVDSTVVTIIAPCVGLSYDLLYNRSQKLAVRSCHKICRTTGELCNWLQRVWALSISWTIISAISAIKQDYEVAMDPKNKVFWEEFIEIYRQNSCLWEVKSKDYSNKIKRNSSHEVLLRKLPGNIQELFSLRIGEKCRY
jgi:hypothetical protein